MHWSMTLQSWLLEKNNRVLEKKKHGRSYSRMLEKFAAIRKECYNNPSETSSSLWILISPF